MVRIKHRYLLIVIKKTSFVNFAEFQVKLLRNIKGVVNRVNMDIVAASLLNDLQISYFVPTEKFFILRCAPDAMPTVKTIINNMNLIDDQTIKMETLHVSGSVRQCQRYCLKTYPRHCSKHLYDKKFPRSVKSEEISE